VRTGLDTLGAKNAIAVRIHVSSWKLENGAAIEPLVASKAVLCLALATDFGLLFPNLKWGEHGGDADKESDGAEVEAKGPFFKNDSYPYCPHNYRYNESGGEARTVRNPISVVQKNEDKEEN
tara:strand:+ start:1769 stop:2134 length:366 start_codon:yes stop_codon:yes gene_type:complete